VFFFTFEILFFFSKENFLTILAQGKKTGNDPKKIFLEAKTPLLYALIAITFLENFQISKLT